MRFKKHSSAPSSRTSSNLSLNLFDVNENETDFKNLGKDENDMLSPKVNEDTFFSDIPADTGKVPSHYKTFTNAHPLGNLLLKLTSMNLELCKKANITDPGMPTLDDTCNQFFHHMQYEKNNMANKISSLTSNIEDSILSKELNFSAINSSIKPPEKFSTVPVITNATKLAEVLKAFPSKNFQKFNGESKGVNILEFLNSLNTGQEIMNLSRPEFLQIVLKCVSGKVYNLISEYISHDTDVHDLYTSLLSLYDSRMSATDARKILATFKTPSNSSLMKTQSYIIEVASRVASALPKGPSRTSMFNLESNQALVRALPPESSTVVTNVMNTLTAKLQRQPTFVEVTKALTKFADTINADIERNGVYPKKNNGQLKMGNKHFKLFSVNASENSNQNKSWRNKNENTSYGNKSRNFKVNTFSNRKFKDSPKNERHFNLNTGEKGRKKLFCSLCAGNNHTAVQGCLRMRDDNHRVINVIPSYKHCEKCFEEKNVKLFHPPSACILREVYLKNEAARKKRLARRD